MNIKKIIIVIAFVAVSLIAGRAYACTVYDPYCTDYQPALPHIYGGEEANQGYGSFGSSQNGNTMGGYTGQQVAFAGQQVAPTPYIPASPIIMNGDGTYTEQNSGKVIGKKNTTATQSGTTTTSTTTGDTNTTEDTSLFGGIFGSKKTLFSNGTNTVAADQNLQALVQSKGLALGTNGTACTNNQDQQYLVLYKNITGTVITNTAIRLSLPSGITPKNTSGGSYSERDNTLTFFVGTLNPEQSGQFIVQTHTTGSVSGVARTELVYTLPTQDQNMIVAYAFGDGTCNTNALGASAIGSGSNFFGGTFLGWLFLALFVSAFIYLIRFFLIKKNSGHGHDDGHGHH